MYSPLCLYVCIVFCMWLCLLVCMYIPLAQYTVLATSSILYLQPLVYHIAGNFCDDFKFANWRIMYQVAKFYFTKITS